MTALVKALAKSFSAEFKRVQFTPDLLPTDILGSAIHNPRDGSFTFRSGPIFTNIHFDLVKGLRRVDWRPDRAARRVARCASGDALLA
jgi:hypothetical protein